MKNNMNISLGDRIVFQSFLIFEQILGQKLFKVFHPLKKLFLSKLLLKLDNADLYKKVKVHSVQNLQKEEFYKEYFNKSTPVLFKDAAKDWGCCRKWDLDYFRSSHGKEELLIVNAEGLTSREKHADFEFLSVKELVEDIKNGGKKYLRFSPLLENNPELAEDLDLNWLEKMKGEKTFASTYYMFMGGAGQKTLLHTDQPCNLYVQIHGRKKWTLYSPKDSALLYPEILNTAYVKSPIDVDKPDFDKFPLFRHARAFEVTLEPGDVLYVPPHTWHFVENLDETIAVGFRFSSLKAALKASWSMTLLRVLSTNPPIWKTMQYGKLDTNLIWAHTGGTIKELLKARSLRSGKLD